MSRVDDREADRDPARHLARALESAERVRDACQQAILDLGQAVVDDEESSARLDAARGTEPDGSTLRNLAALNETRVRACLARCVELARGLARVGLTGRPR